MSRRILPLGMACVVLASVGLAQTQLTSPNVAPQYQPGSSNSVNYNVLVTDDDDDNPPGNAGDQPANAYTVTTYVCSSNSSDVRTKVTVSQSVTQGGDQPAGGGRPTAAQPTTVSVTVTIPANLSGAPTITVYTRAASPEDPLPTKPKEPRGVRACVQITPTG